MLATSWLRTARRALGTAGPQLRTYIGGALKCGVSRKELVEIMMQLVPYAGVATAINGVIAEPAWKTKPSWYLHVTTDKMIPPQAQQFMAERAKATIAEVAGSHAIFLSRPEVVAQLIETAANAVSP